MRRFQVNLRSSRLNWISQFARFLERVDAGHLLTERNYKDMEQK